MTVKIVGNVAVVQTAITKEGFERVQRWSPELLSLKDEKGSPVFTLTVGEGSGSVSKYGATLVPMPNGKLGINLPTDGGAIDGIKTRFVEANGRFLTQLSKIEEAVKAASETLETQETALMSSITVE